MSNDINNFKEYLLSIKQKHNVKPFEVLVCYTLLNILRDFDGDFKEFKQIYLRCEAVEDGTFTNLIWSDDISYIFHMHGAEIVAICFECLDSADDIAGFTFPIHEKMTRSAFYLVMSSLVDDFVLGGLDNE